MRKRVSADDRVTIETVARDAGVSQSTVSRVLNQPALVRVSTRDAVYSALKKHNYIPPPSTRSETDRNYTFALAVHDAQLPVVYEVIRAIETQLAETTYDLLVVNMRGTRDVAGFFRENDHVRRKIDGLMAFSADLDEGGAAYFRQVGLPVVLMQSRCTAAKSISTNNFLGGQDAAVYLFERGYNSPAFIGWRPDDHRVRARFAGYKSALEQHGVTFEQQMAAFAELSAAGGYEATAALLEDFAPDALFYACDTMAIGGLRYFRTHHIAVPDQVGVVGFDDLEIAEVIGLTTMRQFIDVKARMAVEHLLTHLQHGGGRQAPALDEISITPRIAVRETTR